LKIFQIVLNLKRNRQGAGKQYAVCIKHHEKKFSPLAYFFSPLTKYSPIFTSINQ